MSGSAERLLHLLADGALHSGERLARELGVTRAAVWKLVAELRERGVAVASHDRRGYQLEHAVELLEVGALQAAAGGLLPASTEVFFELGSTNDYLHAAAAPDPAAPRLVFAELQTAGRGRRGRDWIAPFGSGLTFSIGWTFAEMRADLSALGLALGVCVVRALRLLDAPEVQLKWPNDIVHRHAKLGGLLLQMRAEAGGPAYVIAGLGLNLRLPPAARAGIGGPQATPITDLADSCSGPLRPRSEIAACVAGHMLDGLATFAQAGFGPFERDWAAFDSLRDAPVTVLRPDGEFAGVARGVEPEGALRVETPAGLERVHAGDVSLRPASRDVTGAA